MRVGAWSSRCGRGFSPPFSIPLVSFFLLVSVLLASSSGLAQEQAQGVTANLGNFWVRSALLSAEEIQFHQVVRQALERSCGTASLATILKYYFGEDVTERDLILEAVNGKTAEQLKTVNGAGFSLLDLKKVAEQRGYKATGVRLDLANLGKLGQPAIILLKYGTDSHFVVVRGVAEGWIFLADPLRGNVAARLTDFSGMWNGIALVVGHGPNGSNGHASNGVNGFLKVDAAELVQMDVLDMERYRRNGIESYPVVPNEL